MKTVTVLDVVQAADLAVTVINQIVTKLTAHEPEGSWAFFYSQKSGSIHTSAD